jgi:hypothetical protein
MPYSGGKTMRIYMDVSGTADTFDFVAAIPCYLGA